MSRIASIIALLLAHLSRPWRICHGFTLRSSRSSQTKLDSTTSLEPFGESTSPPITEPLCSHTFAGMVEEAMIEKFGGSEEEIQRVLESWRLLELGYEHKQTIGPSEHDVQHAVSYVRDLQVQRYHDINDYAWCMKLKKKYSIIKREFDAVMKDRARLQQEGNNVWASALTEDASSYGVGWKTLVLMNRGIWDPTNVSLFPQTAKAVRDAKVPAAEVFFASMDAGSNIEWHSDFTNFVLTSHLAIDVPGTPNQCRLTIGSETKAWENGQIMLFDTSVLHAAVNEASATRYILMMRVWHPDLTRKERDALQFIYDCLEYPDLISSDAAARAQAEEQLAVAKEFPLAKNRLSGGSGFGASSGNSKGKKKQKTR